MIHQRTRTRGGLGLLLGALLLGGVAPQAQASDARRHGLAGNLGFEDDTDVFAFPQLTARYGDRLQIDATDDGQTFRGGVVLGGDTALGLFVLRPSGGDWFQPYDDAATLQRRLSGLPGVAAPAGLDLQRPQPMIDLRLGLRSGFGLGLAIANSMQTRQVPQVQAGEGGAEPTTTQVEEGSQFTSVALSGGWSERRSDRRIDLAAELTFQRAKTVVDGKIHGESSLSPSFSLLGRGVLERSRGMAWVGLAQLYRRNYDLDLPYASNSIAESLLGLRVGLGPRVALGDGVALVGLAWIGMEQQSYELGTAVEDGTALAGQSGRLTDTVSRNDYLLPGLDVALEVEAKDWIQFRVGWTSRYHVYGYEGSPDERVDKPLGEPGGSAGASTALESRWAAGATLAFDRLRVDGSFTPGFLTSGPDFLGGRGPGTFAWLGIGYTWGSGAAPAPQESAGRRSRRAAPSAPGPDDPGYYPPAPAPYPVGPGGF